MAEVQNAAKSVMWETTGIQKKLEEAEMVLVGLGEEFDDVRRLQSCGEYLRGAQWLKDNCLFTFLPAWNEFCLEKQGGSTATEALERLRALLWDKNYFVVSVAMNSEIAGIPWKSGRLVMPCGSSLKLQCRDGCAEILQNVSTEVRSRLWKAFGILYKEGKAVADELSAELGACENCGAEFVFNNIYAENYNENGYLPQWQLYTKWLQGTVNRRLLVLEMGVGMHFPSVIRWPFEKAAYFNQKAFFCRVNENLYQLTEELSGKGVGIPQNAIDWLRQL